LVELLIVISIIGLLIQLILPAVQSAREAARATVCQNNLRQVSTAFMLHHDTHRRLPSGGWGWLWAPDPDAGTGPKQPGSWAYSLLPYMEQAPLYELGKGANPKSKSAANKQRLETPVEIFYCPSRRPAGVYRIHPAIPFVRQPFGCDQLEYSSRIDFAANGGGHGYCDWRSGPDSIEKAKDYEFFNPDDGYGILFPRSEITYAQITDGTSNTYLVGEKYLAWGHYYDGMSIGDDQGPFVSDDRDSVRFAGGEVPAPDNEATDAKQDANAIDPKAQSTDPKQDGEEDFTLAFGSAHPTGFFMAFCDGSIRRIEYGIDATIHQHQANRADDH
jgi:type II secretory pathway pseudopilin PulG